MRTLSGAVGNTNVEGDEQECNVEVVKRENDNRRLAPRRHLFRPRLLLGRAAVALFRNVWLCHHFITVQVILLMPTSTT